MNTALRFAIVLASRVVLIKSTEESARRTQALVARSLDQREERYEIAFSEEEHYALRDKLSRD